MPDTASHDNVPQITLGWRLRIALERADIKAEAMATELGVHRGTVTRWTHDIGRPPRPIYLRKWAEVCRVPYGWLAGDAVDNRQEQRRDIHENQPGGLLFAAA